MFGVDVAMLGIGFRFFFGRREGGGFWDVLIPILALIVKFSVLGFGVFWAVAMFRIQVFGFVLGAGFVLFGWSILVFLRGLIKR